MKQKSNIWDIFKNKGQWDIKPVMAFLFGTTYSLCAVLDSAVKGVDVNDTVYWVTAFIILGLIAADSLKDLVALRTGQATVEQNKNNFDQQVNNLEQGQNNKDQETK
jgi:hypothetical protein